MNIQRANIKFMESGAYLNSKKNVNKKLLNYLIET